MKSPDEELPVLATLHGAENMALTIARAQIGRGENPPINVTTMLVMALDRISGYEDWTLDEEFLAAVTRPVEPGNLTA